MPILRINECPWCRVPFLPCKLLPEACNLGLCNICGNVVACYLSDDGTSIESSTFDQKWLYGCTSDEQRKLLHEAQERHFEHAHQWG